MPVRKFPKNELVDADEIELPWEIDPKRGKILSDETIDTSRRWEDTQELIFELDGKTYRTYYNRGKTEYQETLPWEYEDTIECEEVVKIPVMVQKWVPVEETQTGPETPTLPDKEEVLLAKVASDAWDEKVKDA